METSVVGKGLPKFDAYTKAKGTIAYADDFSLPGMLYAKVLRSKYPAAMIISINTARAKSLPGVHAVMTGKDVPHNNLRAKFGQSTDIGPNFEGLYRVLAEEKVRFLGEAIALVAADSEKIAEEALALIDVIYEQLPGVFDPIEALKQDAYLVGDNDTNLVSQFKIRQGDVETAFKSADVIVENTYSVPFKDHAFLEPESGVAWVDENGIITIRVCTQVIEHFRTVAEVLGIPHNHVRVIGTWVGGGFGGKEDITVESFLALLTWKTKRPVKLTYTREESFLAHSKRHPFVMKYKTGATKDGLLVALEAELIADSGAYTYLSPWVLLYATVNAAGPYNIPNVKVDTVAVLTNNPFSSAYRGFGAVQPNFAYESQMDELARILDLDPLTIRLKNCLQQGDTLTTGADFGGSVAVREVAEKAWQALGPKRADPGKHIKLGRGLAVGMMSYGRLTFLHDTSRSYIKLELDGSVLMRSGIPDLGAGQAQALVQIAAEELGVPLEKIKIFTSDTSLTPLAGTSTATRQLYMSGNATLKAAREVKERLINKASVMLKADKTDLKFENEKIIRISEPDKYLALSTVIGQCSTDGDELYSEAQFNAPFTEVPVSDVITGQTFADFTFGAYAVEVAIDEETGEVNVERAVTCYDVGKAINPLNVEGQLEGGGVDSIGYALTENFVVEQGYLKSHSLAEYLLPTALDVPDIETILVESGAGIGPYGAKGIGEPACNAMAPAIINAIRDAVGVRITSLPATPEKILFAMLSRIK
ncbi:xanthine dehydrogenase family protein molybdopterin-binding subunit [Desulfosporosinus sp.]|uniref:xanthine dehydrogenase family protein molybdopterin-binding subunit n=1 Tax=Desulfosporosinus sp. TaxID=157907 RepID=UPI0025C6551B|nr:xanthine dehydrogenase family protein molybdopterin-binding subunit [Desulfosporosinus sp.]MBC2721560.1 xanthine dehydrogenase family protein molybdopterin-binding subunit [Desulfosporosinus sp.]MBC2727028.1 xanthine dehydrogenase family protein molybdopterin-binding subunit [Desulfosporosinus sp.]